MRVPMLTIPFRFFQGGHMPPESSQRVVNYPVRSRDFPQRRPTIFDNPWRVPPGPGYQRVMTVVNHLTGTRSRSAAPPAAAPGPAWQPPQQPQYQQPAYAAPSPEIDYQEIIQDEEPVDGPRPVPASARRLRW